MHSETDGAISWLFQGAEIVRSEGCGRADLRVRGGRVHEVAPQLTPEPDEQVLDLTGRWIFPGLIDTQVHFREPGLTHKEDIGSGSHAAVAGGVTAFCEMPNTNPSTIDPQALRAKLDRAKETAWCDHAFFLGGTEDNAEQLGEWETAPGCAGVKVFMGSSTGSLLVKDDAPLERIMRHGTRRMSIHSEDEARLLELKKLVSPGDPVTRHPEFRDVEAAMISTTRLLNLAERTGRKCHALHISTADEIRLVQGRGLGELVTLELTPNHLFLSAPSCYEPSQDLQQRYGMRGSWAQMNPPVRDRAHQEVLREALADGTIACIGSDHAPHALEEKAKDYPMSPSGIPGVQNTLWLLLTAVRDGWLRREDIPRLLVEGPVRIFGIEDRGQLRPGERADLVVVDPGVTGPLEPEHLLSRSPCSPYLGMERAGWPVLTLVGGQVAWAETRPGDGAIPGGPPCPDSPPVTEALAYRMG